MRTFRNILVGIGLAGALSLSVIWGTRAPVAKPAISAAAETIQKPGHLALAEVYIQKPGH